MMTSRGNTLYQTHTHTSPQLDCRTFILRANMHETEEPHRRTLLCSLRAQHSGTSHLPSVSPVLLDQYLRLITLAWHRFLQLSCNRVPLLLFRSKSSNPPVLILGRPNERRKKDAYVFVKDHTTFGVFDENNKTSWPYIIISDDPNSSHKLKCSLSSSNLPGSILFHQHISLIHMDLPSPSIHALLHSQ